MFKIRLTDAQASAIECRHDGFEQVDGLEVDGRHLVVRDVRDVLGRLTDACNAEDAAHQELGDVFAGRAARSLCSIQDRIIMYTRRTP